jgi:hypothetical protein
VAISLRKINIARNAILARATQQRKQMRTFGLACPAAKQNNQTCKWRLLLYGLPSQIQKMVTVTTDDGSLYLLHVIKNKPIRSCGWKEIPQTLRAVFPVSEQL